MATVGSWPAAIEPGDGEAIRPLAMVHKVRSAWANDGLSILEGVINPGSLIPPHTHSREDECTYVLEGQLTFDVGGRVVTLGPGSYVVKPRDVFHAFWNATDKPARVMEIHAPGTFDAFYGELAEILTRGLPPDQQGPAIGALNARYGLAHHVERIPEYVSRYGVRP
jgi:quercetin dioxygenase-like cupin family protein